MVSIIRKSNLLLNKNNLFSKHLKIQFNSKHNQIMRNFTKKSIYENEDNLSSNIKSLVKPFIFTVGFSGTAFVLCNVYNYEKAIVFRRKFINNWSNNWSKTTNNLETNRKNGQFRDELNKWWNTRSQGFKVFSAIALINGIVFIGWKIPRLQTFLFTYFMTNSSTRSLRCWPMLFSTFSHYSAPHLMFNMIAFYSFSQIGVQLLGIEQFIALYLSSGVISSFASYVFRVIAVRNSTSLGASGAILGILSSCCVALPDMQLSIIFLPFITMSSGIALKGILLLDTMGLILKWSYFDHAAHLGGTLFGIWFTLYGQQIIINNRSVIEVWKQIRNKFGFK